jgi:serine/threonine-protein kinase
MKPHNVFLLKDGTVKIFDFDLSRFSGQEEPELHEGRFGYIIGTPSYIAPEAFSGQKPDHRADIYAVGMIMYRMLCGELPIDSNEVYKIIARLINDRLLPPSSKNPSVPDKADRITMRALEKEPDLRYQSTEEMRRALLSGTALTTRIPALRFGIAEVGPEDPTVLAGIVTKTIRVACP